MESTIPVNLEPFQPGDHSERRLWIGNLDNRINEYQLLKMVRVYGNIEKFDLLFHRSGPSAGQPRGFAFVTYKNCQDALRAMNSLNGQMLGTKKIVVKYAKNTTMDDTDRRKQDITIPALAGAKTEPKVSKKTAIQSIEAKLKMMETLNSADEFVVNKLAAAESSVVAQYQTKQSTSRNNNTFKRRHPYHRKR